MWRDNYIFVINNFSKKGLEMKKTLLWIIVMVLSISMVAAFSLYGCKAEEAVVEEEADEEAPAEEVAEEAPAEAEAKRFDGITITLGTEDVLAESAKMFRDEWSEKTGGKVEISTVPYGELYTKLMTPFATGVPTFDVIFFPGTWLATFADNEYIQPLDKWIKEDVEFNWGEIPEKIKDFSTWGDKIYAIPGDGDTMLLYYRKDAIENPEYQKQFKEKYGYELTPPKTWDQYKDIAEFFNNWDWDKDGVTNYGAAEARKKATQAVWTYLARASSYVCTPGSKGALFFDPNGMTPLINSPGHVKALEDYIEVMKFCSPGVIDYGVGEVRQDFYLGKIALTIDWGDTAQFAANADGTVVSDKTGYALVPGVNKTWDYEKKEWVDYPDINVAPFLAFGGWVYGITSSTEHADAAYDLVSFLAGPENSMIEAVTDRTGVQPFRESHYTQIQVWKDAGFKNPEEYMEVYKAHFSHPNAQIDLRIPEMARYQEALDTELAIAVAGEKTPQQALDDAAKAWDKITDEIGREKQIELYRIAIGYNQ